MTALATDILLYDRIILPVPEDEVERKRWVARDWAPDEIALRAVQAADLIIPVPWTAQLRQEWADDRARLRDLGEEFAYGLTSHIYASSPRAWEEIHASLDLGQEPSRRPFLIAGYQSQHEAVAELALSPLVHAPPAGDRPVDRAVALHVQRLVEEPHLPDPQEAFLTSVALAEKEQFVKARDALFDWEDRLYVDGWEPDEVTRELGELEQEYNAQVRTLAAKTRNRQIASLLPATAGIAAVLTGHPHLKVPVTKALSWVLGRFAPAPTGPLDDAGQAFSLIRAAYRDAEARPTSLIDLPLAD